MVKLLLELDELISCILGKAAILPRGLDRTHVDLCFVGACSTIVPGELGVKYGVVLSEKGVEVSSAVGCCLGLPERKQSDRDWRSVMDAGQEAGL